MKIDNVKIPKSSFLSVEKDASIIIDRFLSNQRLKKLLFYSTKDCLSQPNLTTEQSIALLGKQIKIIPKVYIDTETLTYIIIAFDNFYKNPTNPEFRNNRIDISIMCHFDQWVLKDYQLRPYKIAAEVDSMLDKTKLSGIGVLDFIGATQILTNDEFAGLNLSYEAIHGEEDKKFMLNPQDDEQFVKDFFERVNSQ